MIWNFSEIRYWNICCKIFLNNHKPVKSTGASTSNINRSLTTPITKYGQEETGCLRITISRCMNQTRYKKNEQRMKHAQMPITNEIVSPADIMRIFRASTAYIFVNHSNNNHVSSWSIVQTSAHIQSSHSRCLLFFRSFICCWFFAFEIFFKLLFYDHAVLLCFFFFHLSSVLKMNAQLFAIILSIDNEG